MSTAQPIINVYAERLSSAPDPGLEFSCLSLLSREERIRNARFAAPLLRWNDLQVRTLVRRAISLHAAVPPHELRLERMRGGKPSVAAEHREHAAIEFSIAHTSKVVVVAVGLGQRLGIDIEVGPVDDSLLDSPLVLATEERAYLRLIVPEKRARGFLELWTLKEAFLKAMGTGLSVSPSSVVCDISRSGVLSVQFSEPVPKQACRWQFMQFDAGDDGVISLCIEGACRPSVSFSWLPGFADPIDFNWPVLRSTC